MNKREYEVKSSNTQAQTTLGKYSKLRKQGRDIHGWVGWAQSQRKIKTTTNGVFLVWHYTIYPCTAAISADITMHHWHILRLRDDASSLFSVFCSDEEPVSLARLDVARENIKTTLQHQFPLNYLINDADINFFSLETNRTVSLDQLPLRTGRGFNLHAPDYDTHECAV